MANVGRRGTQVAPTYYGYNKGTWANVTQCEDCLRTGLYEDQPPSVRCCPECGGKVKNIGTGKYHEPEMETFYLWGIPIGKEIVVAGYWEVRHG